MALTKVYVRLCNECDKQERAKVLKNFKTIMTSLNITNYTLNALKCNDSLSIVRYIDMLPISQAAKNALYKSSYKQLEKFDENHTNVNTIFWGIETEKNTKIRRKIYL